MEKTQRALSAASMFYMQDLTMEAIARELNTSRSSVSRLLSFARDTGLVDIQIKSPQDEISGLGSQLRERYAVTVHIVAVPDHISDVDRLERVAMSAARTLGRFFDSAMTMGIAWGSTLSAVSRHLAGKDLHEARIVQLNGAGNSLTTGVTYASEILRRFGDAYNASVHHFPVPAFFDHAETKTALWRERSIRRVLDVRKRMDVALFSLGASQAEVPSQVYLGGYLDAADVRTLRQERIVGDVATVFFRADGSYADIPLNARSSGPDLRLLRRVPRRICVISGTAKLPSLRGALAAGLITDLIIDQSTAHKLLEATPQPPRRR